ncbi:hypothetical protein EBR57_08100 [bacterium]|nr:hypothetical protein [bacterium]
MTEEEIQEITRRVVAAIQGPSVTSSIEIETYADIDQQIELVPRMQEQLALAVRSVIPNEEPHDYVLSTLLEWLETASKAQIGTLRIRRNALRAYTDAELNQILVADDMLASPADQSQLVAARKPLQQEVIAQLPVEQTHGKEEPLVERPWYIRHRDPMLITATVSAVMIAFQALMKIITP